MSIRCICVDDEPLARQGLRLALAPYDDFELVVAFGAADEALANLPEGIDVVFLDIEMPRQNGFEMLKNWPGVPPLVIFVTAYDQYALKAFEEQALDYVLKPIDEDRFAQVVVHIRERLSQNRDTDYHLKTISSLEAKLDEATISVKTDEGYFRIKLSDCLYVESVGDLVCLHMVDRQLISRGTLKKYLVELSNHRFYQVHKSYLVNAKHVKQISKLRFGDQLLVLSNEKELRVSRRYKSVIGELIG